MQNIRDDEFDSKLFSMSSRDKLPLIDARRLPGMQSHCARGISSLSVMLIDVDFGQNAH